MISRFGKKSNDISNIKESFSTENKDYLENALTLNSIYTQQPTRVVCKICGEKISFDNFDFINHGVKYKLCDSCGHLNGAHEETDTFHEFIYGTDENNPNVYDSRYSERLENIYMPKASFLIDSLVNEEKDITISDFGCGAGHFVNSLVSMGYGAIGYDICESSLRIAQTYYSEKREGNRDRLTGIFTKVDSVDDMTKIAGESNCLVHSYIGVLEHIKSPHKAFEAFCRSNAKYIFFSVPLFSLSVLIENVFKDVFPRHLSSDHTQLFTYDSINHLLTKYNLETVSQWHFGSDILDLKRSMLLELKNNNSSSKFLSKVNQMMLGAEIIDKLQLILDENKLNSEVHIIAKKR